MQSLFSCFVIITLFHSVRATYVFLPRQTTSLIGVFHLIQIHILNIIMLFFSPSNPLKLRVETSPWDRTPEWQCALSKTQAEEGNTKESLWAESKSVVKAPWTMFTVFCITLYFSMIHWFLYLILLVSFFHLDIHQTDGNWNEPMSALKVDLKQWEPLVGTIW